jgi:hypothetical protein
MTSRILAASVQHDKTRESFVLYVDALLHSRKARFDGVEMY